MPDASIVGFTKPSEALEFSRNNNVALAFLDIELGKSSGLDLCRKLLDINPLTNVVFLTAYIDYSFDAWDTGACGFLMKPLTVESVQKQLTRLRHPL
jgi:two-component SAPR family response regulator